MINTFCQNILKLRISVLNKHQIKLENIFFIKKLHKRIKRIPFTRRNKCSLLYSSAPIPTDLNT